MKKIKLAVFAMVIACGAFATVAATTTNSKPVKSDPGDLIWFDAVSGLPIGERTPAEQQTLCGTPGSHDCAYGYEMDDEGNPVGEPTVTTKP